MTLDKKTTVAVLIGGPSSEHEVSLKSGEVVFRTLDPERYAARKILISKTGEWESEPRDMRKSAGIAFIAMHGTYGEDGTVQSLLEQEEIPYTGSDSLSSALGMNKFLSTRHFKDHGLPVPVSCIISRKQWGAKPLFVLNQLRYYVGYPLIVKPNNQGSSVGVTIARNEGELEQALETVFRMTRDAIVQEYIEGRELTCGVLDYGWKESAYPLLPTEIIPRTSHFFDYRAKYEPDASLEITPPELPEPVLKTVQQLAVEAHRALGCSGFSRTDFILDRKGNLFILETNTIPGLTEQSLLPKAARASSIPLSDLLHRVIQAGLAKFEKARKQKGS